MRPFRIRGSDVISNLCSQDALRYRDVDSHPRNSVRKDAFGQVVGEVPDGLGLAGDRSLLLHPSGLDVFRNVLSL